ncbi:unnamed protein product [Pseudo-nitzschia multistriata]|uniref:Uncharacterized protein n=1 Tax=Pseudo-nitzschia multistriata TaxID=183589 RepID=A0A448Z8U3_9STRA|nr:unnamed protein product [Pseudo-nitzschia multistriata]
MFLPKGYFDVDKFRSVYLKQTHWARLLALAAGESDTDAVQTNFDESRRKPREHYLKKHFDNNIDNAATNNDVDIPNFMKTIVSTARPTKKLNLDANTISQICFRNSQIDPRSDNSKLKGHNNKKKNKVTGKTQLSSKPAAPESPSSPDEEGKAKETVVNDDASTSTEDSSTSNLAKMAAGWGGDESSSQEDMSFVLIGMGIAEKPNITVG